MMVLITFGIHVRCLMTSYTSTVQRNLMPLDGGLASGLGRRATISAQSREWEVAGRDVTYSTVSLAGWNGSRGKAEKKEEMLHWRPKRSHAMLGFKSSKSGELQIGSDTPNTIRWARFPFRAKWITNRDVQDARARSVRISPRSTSSLHPECEEHPRTSEISR